MALKTNSKQAMSNLYNYIREYCEDYITESYEQENLDSKKALYTAIYEIFKSEMHPECPYYRRYPEQEVFKQWAQGLAMGGLFCYYYNREAKKDLAGILEETEEEASKFTEERAEELLTYLIYREITKEARKA